MWLMRAAGCCGTANAMPSSTSTFTTAALTPPFSRHRRFYRLVRGHVNDDGIVMLNLFDKSKDRELLQCTSPPCAGFSLRDDGEAGRRTTSCWRSPGNVPQLPSRSTPTVEGRSPSAIAQYAAQNVVDVVAPPGTPVFTDDWAPV